MDKDQALQYGFKSGPKILIKIRPYNMNKDQTRQYGLKSGPTIWIKTRPDNIH